MVSNRKSKQILKNIMSASRKDWSKTLDNSFQPDRSTFKTPIKMCPFRLVYGKACHLPIELEHRAYWDMKTQNFDIKVAKD